MSRPEGSASVAFAPFTVPSRNMRVTVRAGADALATDNVFNLVVSPSTPVRIVVVDSGTKAGAGLYPDTCAVDWRRAEVRRSSTGSRQPCPDDDLRRASVVLLNDVDVNAGLGRRLARFVQDGGGLFVAAGPRATWPQGGRHSSRVALAADRQVARRVGPRGRARVRPPGVRSVPRAAQRRFLDGALLCLSLGDRGAEHAGARAFRRGHAGARRTEGRQRTRDALGLDAGSLVE